MDHNLYMYNPFAEDDKPTQKLQQSEIVMQPELEILTRETLLDNIESDLLLINSMMKDFLLIAQEQDTYIDSICYNIKKSTDNISSGLDSLEKAKKN